MKLPTPQSLFRAWSAGLVCLICAGVIWLITSLYTMPPSETRIDSLLAQQLVVPNAGLANPASWERLVLPNRLCHTDCRSRFKLYQYALPGAATEASANYLYLTMFDGAAEIYFNGVAVGQSGSVEAPYIDTTYQPLGILLPSHLWQPQGNKIQILVASVLPRGGRLAPFYLGTQVQLHDASQLARFLTVDILGVLLGVTLVLALCSGLVYAAGDRDRIYLWFIGLLSLIALRCVGVVFPGWPEDVMTRHGIYLFATLGVLMTSAGFVARLADRAPSRFDLSLLVAWVPISVVIYATLQIDFWYYWALSNQFIGWLVVSLGGWLVVRFVLHTRTLPLLQRAVTTAALGAGLVFLFHDVWFVVQREVLLFQLSNLAAIPIMVAFCVALATRYGKHVGSVRRANSELALAVDQTRAQLAESYEQLLVHERQQTLRAERKRMLQDVHDGVGGKLAALVQRMRGDARADPRSTLELEESVLDLRLIIDSLDDLNGQDVGMALGVLRQRSEAWLAAYGIALDWEVAVADLHEPRPDLALILSRIVQEALNNVVRHAQASQVCVRASTADGELLLVVQDNGRGLPSDFLEGRGLSIMRQRTTELGGVIDLDTTVEGTTLCLRLPHVHGTQYPLASG